MALRAPHARVEIFHSSCSWKVRTPSRSFICSRRDFNTSAEPTEASIADPTGYCRDLVRKYDYEGFLVSQFYPGDLRGGYFALKAFSVELAMVQDHVSNQMIGKMRMQFWRDAVKGIGEGKPPRHPIALALHEYSQRSNIPAYHLKRIVDARDHELHTPTHLTTDSLTAHAESTSSTMFYLLLSLLSLPSSALSHAASHLGAAQTFVTLLRGLPFHAKSGRMIIPAEITAKHGVSQEDVFRHGPRAQGIEDAVFEFATLANDHLLTARDMLNQERMGGKVPTRAMPVFLAGIPIASFLGRLEKANFDVFTPDLQLRDWKLPWQIWRGYYKKQF
ncbi:NADH dehydrogenase (ubiquinone) complex I, assembly factor 6 [Hypsizygus marmoreus]|uniref:NADH dehydrogenase (Ubiquinone) complex I, assembly factor 6 n=1 Tax=Hypsizygus marmoreus TaxID=39966 RepID=A0A369J7E0_HYPMA|nr:NADH dehydrogenase (ubiquinone) complex I, assembly factor 6 [Hypsizygus marmoreus]